MGIKSVSRLNYVHLIFKRGVFLDSVCDEYHQFHKLILAGCNIFQFNYRIIKLLHKLSHN